jgi:hypothetical protein
MNKNHRCLICAVNFVNRLRGCLLPSSNMPNGSSLLVIPLLLLLFYDRTAPLAHGAGMAIAWSDDPFTQTNVPSGLTNLVAVAAGGHSLALLADSTVAAWGYNESGQTTVPRGLTNVVAVAAGHSHSLALRADGTVAAWGSNGSGQATVPPGLNNVVALAAGGDHSLALRADGTIAAWGDSSRGQTNAPAGLSNAVAAAAGWSHCLALRTDGSVVAWGDNGYGQANVPAGLSKVVAIAAGSDHSLALRVDGTVAAWGGNNYGQANVPVGLNNVVAIAAGSFHSLALRADGTVAAWGSGWNDTTFVPVTVPATLSNVVAVAAGEFHSLALISDVPGSVELARQPWSQAVFPGANASLFVLAIGAPPLRYQWRLNGTNITGATNVAYTITAAHFDRLGEYSVVVANSYGSVTSSAVVLTDYSTCAWMNLIITNLDNKVLLSWPNSLTFYDLQSRADLSNGSWDTISSNTLWAGNRYYATNPMVPPSRYFRLASRDSFAGTFTPLFDYDNNIKDGVSLVTTTIPFIVSRQDSTNFVIASPSLGFDLPAALSGNTLRNKTRPMLLPTSNILDVLLLSDGVNKVFTWVGQDKSDPVAMSFHTTCWTEARGTLAASDLVGTWACQGYINTNLRDTSGFGPIQITGTVTAVGQNKILLAVPDRGFSGTFTISGMEATLDNVPLTGNGITHSMKIVSNGVGISLYKVTSEINDPTDVSVMVMLGTRQ